MGTVGILAIGILLSVNGVFLFMNIDKNRKSQKVLAYLTLYAGIYVSLYTLAIKLVG